MTPIISRPGINFRAVLDYVLAERKNPDLVVGNMGGQDARELAREFGTWSSFNERVTRPVFHCSLSAAPSDEMTVQSWRAFAQEYLERLGYGDSPWVAVRHGDRDHDHIHIIASRIDSLGRRVNCFNDGRRCQTIMRDLEREFGLRQKPRDWPRSAPTRGQVASFEFAGQVPVVARLQEHVDLAARGKATMSLFIERLEAAGVHARPHFTANGRVDGISFALDGVAVRGARLGRAYSWRGLQQDKEIAYLPARDLSALLSGDTPAPGNTVQVSSPGPPPAREKMPPLSNPVAAYRAAAALAVRVEIDARREQLTSQLGRPADVIRAAEKLVQDRDRLGWDLEQRERVFTHQLGEIFQQPREGARKLTELVDRQGHERAGQLLAQHPESIGSLRGVGVATLTNSSRRGALAAAHVAGGELTAIGRLDAQLVALDERIGAKAPAVAAAREQFASIVKSLNLLPSPASMQKEIARSIEILGTGVVRAMSLAATALVARVLRTVGHASRDQLLERSLGRDDDGLSL
jgi:hypothetical protein